MCYCAPCCSFRRSLTHIRRVSPVQVDVVEAYWHGGRTYHRLAQRRRNISFEDLSWQVRIFCCISVHVVPCNMQLSVQLQTHDSHRRYLDLGHASKILADGFYSDENLIQYQFERLQTFLSLETTFPKPHEQHAMFSLCRSRDGVVLAFCEIDNRPTNKLNAAPRPYMCNLAVDVKSRGSGFGKELVRTAEAQAKDWDQEQLYLKVKKENCFAVGLYSSLGYKVISEELDEKKGWTLLLMRKALHLEDEPLHLEDEPEPKPEPIV